MYPMHKEQQHQQQQTMYLTLSQGMCGDVSFRISASISAPGQHIMSCFNEMTDEKLSASESMWLLLESMLLRHNAPFVHQMNTRTHVAVTSVLNNIVSFYRLGLFNEMLLQRSYT